MRKAIPCSRCGTAKLSMGEDYIVGSIPAKLTFPGGVLNTKCKCGTKNRLTSAEFYRLPNLPAPEMNATEA